MVYEPFEKNAKRYDKWFTSFPGNKIFFMENACLKQAVKGVSLPWLEVGVGTGRFAQGLGISEGVDPASAVLKIAESRGIKTKQGVAESLPYQDASFGGLFMIITLCFLDDPTAAMKECRRVLTKDGSMILGMIPVDSPWGKFYQQRKNEDHVFYKHANFFTVSQAQEIIEKEYFKVENIWSTLTTPPGEKDYPFQGPVEGINPEASFVVIRANCI